MATVLSRPPVARCDAPAMLPVILDRDCALAIWDRARPEALLDLVARLDRETVDDIDAIVPFADASLAAGVLLGAAGYAGETAVALAVEIGELVGRLDAILPAPAYRLRLEIVGTDACCRFHADMVTMRLLVTLHGPGTQWIETAAPETIGQAATGAVAILKGLRLMPEPVVLHRSPPIAGTGAHRVVLVIDPCPGPHGDPDD